MTEADIPTQRQFLAQRILHDAVAAQAQAEREIIQAAGGRAVDCLLWEKVYAARFATQAAIIARHVAETEAEMARREVVE